MDARLEPAASVGLVDETIHLAEVGPRCAELDVGDQQADLGLLRVALVFLQHSLAEHDLDALREDAGQRVVRWAARIGGAVVDGDDVGGTELDRFGEPDVLGDGTVDELFIANAVRIEKAGDGGGGGHRVQRSKVAAVEDAVARTDVSVGHPERIAVEEVAIADRAPDLGELRDRLQVRPRGQRDRIEGPRTAAHQAIGLDARFEQRLHHPDAAGASTPAATEDKDQPSLFPPRLRNRWSAPPPPGGEHGRGSPEATVSHRYYG